ncbi:DUF4410 domain-containing protein [Dissulfurirhabdus thermomarina]|uniref:DUF4410 domain-containing protein n=1 Tax=Dissulfurirhabdus thermomarina TaxID=1765737 RepID=A0A6N9TLK3_DISTH|nr:DUF4410 domain-containing protein [Dissulfurirhabdus thermomarina]NDY41300.1 DUF4410 domain-containing protein [Dissulfurirhabdus thermomarina]NMX23757.1 DUF4410 domain-containing protein [Dissulfurirhabdus thermomarina]
MKGHRFSIFVLILAGLMFAAGCRGGGTAGAAAGPPGPSIKSYADHTFDVRGYVRGMVKGGHNLLIWQDPAVDLSRYHEVQVVGEKKGRWLPVQNRFAYGPFINTFESAFKNALTVKRGSGAGALRVEWAVVACNPGNRAARYLVGMGAGRATGAVVCEVFAPGKTDPVIRVFAKDTASAGGFGGDSAAMLTYIFQQLGFRVGTVLNARIGG